jgi:hypothetical protein
MQESVGIIGPGSAVQVDVVRGALETTMVMAQRRRRAQRPERLGRVRIGIRTIPSRPISVSSAFQWFDPVLADGQSMYWFHLIICRSLVDTVACTLG